ncbi:MAG: 3-phosphoshikimate 1-carboxyvinyltransferase [Clostridia bacterium]
MTVKIHPTRVTGAVKIPPSKSMSHRAIICAALASGTSKISNIAFSEDILTTIEGMKALGAKIDCFDDYVIVDGIKNFDSLYENKVNCNESGSTLRFFIPIFSLTNKEVTFLGKNRLLIRPQAIYNEIFTSRGLDFSQDDKKLTIKGKLPAGRYELAGDVSSQFISGLLFALPMLDGDSEIHVSEPYESRSYVDLTMQMLTDFGIDVKYTDNNTLFIKGNQSYKACDHTVEGDFSQFGFFAVLGAINNTLICEGLRHDSKQGDKQMVQILKDCGVDISETHSGYRIRNSKVNAVDIDLKDCPDLGPILTVLCAVADGKSTIFNAGRLRIKESDRILAMETELRKFGIDISSTNDVITMNGQNKFNTDDITCGHKDHRIVMALSVLATICAQPVEITEAEYIKKSYPNFFEDLEKLGVKVEKSYE